MITKTQADKLRNLIELYRDSEIDDSWKGAGDPSDIDYIELTLERRKRELEEFIAELEGQLPVKKVRERNGK